jgi:structure-specific endonuclease subunit SLX1
MEVKPIPAFYCCYLLRSTVRKASHYIGSTPHPSRRLGQHNGKVKGGASRTSRASLRPWEMTCIVAGFPSNIAALQFEWAWQNAHLTTHISTDQRISFATTITKTSARTGKTRRKPGRPSTSLLDKLANLHLLLRVPYFSQWPLELRFFNAEVHRSWESWCERVDEGLRPGIKVVLDLPPKEEEEFSSAQRPAKRRRIDLIGKGGVEGIDPTYARFQDVLEKSSFLLDEGDGQRCNVCSRELHIGKDMIMMCSEDGCNGLSHLTCLPKHFHQQHEDMQQVRVPQSGQCPSCKATLHWAELARDLSLRSRGEKEVKKLLSKKKKSKTATAAEILESESEEDGEDGDMDAANVFDEGDIDQNDDAASVTSLDSTAGTQAKAAASLKANRLEIVIEDSDDGW